LQLVQYPKHAPEQAVHLLRCSDRDHPSAAVACRVVRLLTPLPVQAVHLLRRSDIPNAAVDHHVSNILTPLLSNDAILVAAEELGAAEGDDPQNTLRKLLCAVAASPHTVPVATVCRTRCASCCAPPPLLESPQTAVLLVQHKHGVQQSAAHAVQGPACSCS
jgi:hypothetical protein